MWIDLPTLTFTTCLSGAFFVNTKLELLENNTHNIVGTSTQLIGSVT